MGQPILCPGGTWHAFPHDLCKYFFVPEAVKAVGEIGLSIEDLLSPNYAPILDRAVGRIIESLTTSPPAVSYEPHRDLRIELLSFPVAVLLVSALGDEYVKRRYALAEAKRVSRLLEDESTEKVYAVASRIGWRIRRVDLQVGLDRFEYALNFLDYLRAASQLIHEREWKIVNKLVMRGEVYLNKREVARLIEEHVRRYVEGKIREAAGVKLPEAVLSRLNDVRRLRAEAAGGEVHARVPEVEGEVKVDALPPCMRMLYEDLRAGRHIPHVGRFALTSFLLNIGVRVEDVVGLFSSMPDFDERRTRYQVEHIAGKRGSGTRYLPLKCESMRTHGLCPGGDDACSSVRHPLTYYIRRVGKLRSGEEGLRGAAEMGAKKRGRSEKSLRNRAWRRSA